MKQRLRKKYLNDVVPKLQERFSYQNINQIPLIKKVIINRGLGQLQQNNKSIENFSEELAIITGQQGVVTYSKKAIASFKLRKNMDHSCKLLQFYGYTKRLNFFSKSNALIM